jgi:hypothetical protein
VGHQLQLCILTVIAHQVFVVFCCQLRPGNRAVESQLVLASGLLCHTCHVHPAAGFRVPS